MERNSQRLLIRPIGSGDLNNIFGGLSNPELTRFYGVHYDTVEACNTQMDWYRTLEEERKGYWWAVCLKEDRTFIGAGGFNNLDKTHKKAEFGFWLMPEYWGKGYMQEAASMMIDTAFDEWGLHRIEGFVESENFACKKAISKLGFMHEGTMRECERKDGAWISLDIYAIIQT